MFRTLALTGLMAVLTVTATACGGDSDDSPPTQPPAAGSPTPGPAETPASTAEPTSAPTFADLARIILQTARDNRLDLIEELARFSPVPCTTTVEGIGGPPECRAGEANGTPVDVMLGAACEGFYVREGELPFETFALVVDDGPPVFGIYRVTSSNIVQGWPDAKYVVVLQQELPQGGEGALALFTDEVSIVGFMQGCGETPEQFVATQNLTDIVIEPGTAEQPTATP